MGEFLQYADEMYNDIQTQVTIDDALSKILESGSSTDNEKEELEEAVS
ncbi:hypothetical protein [Vibrio cyclitrophicus]|nr:hypothetical protein [Vibrio cyclitrophicus]